MLHQHDDENDSEDHAGDLMFHRQHQEEHAGDLTFHRQIKDPSTQSMVNIPATISVLGSCCAGFMLHPAACFGVDSMLVVQLHARLLSQW
jgi:hypothetical protein